MIELIDKDSNKKVMAMMFGKLCYRGDCYAIYCIRRGKEEANLFVSRMVSNSEGFALDHDFVNGEKEVMEGIIQKLLNKVPILDLEQDGFSLTSDIKLEGIQFFSVKICYVTTVPKILVKDCMLFYGLVTNEHFDTPLVQVADEKGYFNKGFVSNIGVILFGIFVLVACLVGVFSFLFGK